MIRRRPDLFLLIPIVALGVALRLWHAFSAPLWLDEAYSAYAAGKGWAFLWQIVPRYETHPPFYYSLLRGWTLAFGDGRVALRSLGVAASILTLLPVWLAGRSLGRMAGSDPRWVGLAAVLLAASAPLFGDMAQQVRPYAVLIFSFATAIAALLRSAEGVAATGRLPRVAWGAYVAALALCLWLHNLGPLYAAALGLAALVLIARAGLSRREWLLFLGGHALAGLLYLPAFLILLDQAPTWIKSTWLTFRTGALEWRVAALWGVPGRVALWAALPLVLLALLACVRTGAGRRAGFALALLAVLPVATSILLSVWVTPVFIIRTMTPCGIPALLLLALGMAGQRGWLRLLAVPLGLLLVHQQIQASIAARQRPPMQDWAHALRWLAPRIRPGDMLYAYPNEGALPFSYAARDLGLTLPVRAVPTPVPSFDVPGAWYPTGSRGVVSLPKPALERIAAEPATRAVPTVWLLRLGPWAYDKGDLFARALLRDRRIVGRYRNGAIDLVGLRRAER
ncbi:glycosyltransferase family 39 protein [Sphingomonas jatrophae]|uniref:Dolichyl-phosphate-mannose-protein mannosyltransferase n=1 Tax=Sphingomonas jatrophae TaxID=1166337 RepID=A0A1I6LPB0_9SPHN|nr:glycosyltransferase family 39 protein [Sphingomonas jatrophae]SFS05271.1 Dolichyl-phosphate-mannose-protein mannosyltransferase [Sphingomonas jatrophae]